MSENTDFNNEEAAKKLRSDVFMQGFLSELDNDMSPKDMGELYERAKEVLTDDEYLEKIRDKIHDKMKGFEGVSSNSSTGVSRGGGMNNQAPQTGHDNRSQGPASDNSGKFDQYGRIKNPNYSKIKASIIDKLCERNVPAEELDKILEMTRRMVGMSAEELRQAEANAAAEKGNQEITYNDVSLPKGNSISDKLEEVKMMTYCRKSLTNPTIDMLKLKDYIFYTAIKNQKRTNEDAAIKARIASKLIHSAVKKENFELDWKFVDVMKAIAKANPETALWEAAIIKKHRLTNIAPDSNVFDTKLSEFKRALAYDMLDDQKTGKAPLNDEELPIDFPGKSIAENEKLAYVLSAMNDSPHEQLNAIRSHLDYGGLSTGKPMWDTLINIAEQDSKYVPEIMNLLHHKNMEEHRIGTRDYPYHNLNYDYVLLTCLKQKPELITQELYNDIKSQDEKLTEMRNNPYRTEIIHLVGGILPDLSGTGGDEKGRKLIPYMESVNPKLKENWQESQRQQTNLNQGISHGGMGE